ncbi:MAG: hypothetical protein R3B70_44100, partial [Polyangiaceae bacterium]
GAQFWPTVQPGHPDTALVTSDLTGTFITRNGGQSWAMRMLDGTTTSLAFDPSMPDTIYAGTNVGTLLRSSDTGTSWARIYPDPSTVTGRKYVGDHGEMELISTDPGWVGPRTSIAAVTVDPDDPDRLFMGAGAAGSVKVLRSLDAGQTWSEVSILNGLSGFDTFVRLYVDPTSAPEDRRLIAFTTAEAAIVHVTSQSVVSILPPGVDTLTDATMGVGVDPLTGQPVLRLYLTTGLEYNSNDMGSFVTGAYRSTSVDTDSGVVTWAEMNDPGLATRYVPGTSRTYHRIATSPASANTVYMSSVETTDGGNFGIMKSTDAGQTWRWSLEITHPVNKTPGWIEQDYTPDWGGSPLSMTVAADPNIVYATDWGTTYRTTNGGATWEQLYTNMHPDGSATSRGLDVSNSNAIVFDPFDPSHVALVNSSDIGLFDSHDGGASWKHAMVGVPEAWTNSVYSVVFDPAVQGRAWSGWTEVHDLPRYRYIRQTVSLKPGGVCKSDDGLATWQCVDDGANGLPPTSEITSLVLDPTSPPGQRTLYVTAMGHGVYKSTDDGASWAPANDGIQNSGFGDQIYAWQIVRAPSGVLYALIARSSRIGTSSKTANYMVAAEGALYQSEDGATTWSKLALPAGVIFPNNLAVDPKTPDRLYLACWPQTVDDPGGGFIDRFGGLLRSEDRGVSWTWVFDDRAHVYGVTVDPKHDKRVYITTFEGFVLRSNDRGATWGRLGGFDFRWPKNPMVDPFDPHGRLFVTTFGGGVWHGPDEGIDTIPPDVTPAFPAPDGPTGCLGGL